MAARIHRQACRVAHPTHLGSRHSAAECSCAHVGTTCVPRVSRQAQQSAPLSNVGSKRSVGGLRGRSLRSSALPGNGQGLLEKEGVVQQARRQFLHSTRPEMPDELISPSKVCLTIALEEEAALQVFIDNQIMAHSEAFDVTVQEPNIGRSCTWSLERLDMLAAEVMQVFEEQLAAVEQGEGIDDMAARLEALDPADRVDLSQVLELKPKPKRRRSASSPPPPPAPESPKPLRVELFPLLMVNSINEVLYERHGYRRSQQHGEPRDGQITTLLEEGEGSPVLMGILYMEICQRVGLPVACMPINDDGGEYFVLWPTKFPLEVGGHQFIVDPYGNGDLLLRSEVREMFDLVTPSGHCAIRPATNRQILSALLSHMKTSYWARAVGCSPEPAFIEALDCTTVTEMWWGMDWEEGNFNLERALACTERQVHLVPNCQKTQLQYALLQYAVGDYETAWQELGVYLERGGCTDQFEDFQAKLLMERLKLFLEFDIRDRESGEAEFPDLDSCDEL